MDSRYLRLLALVASATLARVDAQFCLFNGYDFSREFTGQTLIVEDPGTGYTGEVTPCARPLNATSCDSTLTPKDFANKIAGSWCYGVMAKLDSSGQWKFVNGANYEDGVMVSYVNGDPCFSGELMAFNLIFKCAETTPQPSFTFTDGFDQCKPEMVVPSKLVCSPPGPKTTMKVE